MILRADMCAGGHVGPGASSHDDRVSFDQLLAEVVRLRVVDQCVVVAVVDASLW